MVQNRWLQHVEKFRRNNKDLKPTELLKKARASYQRGGTVVPYQKDGGVALNAASVKTGGGVVGYQAAKTESSPALVTKGGRRSRRQSRRRSRRTRRR